MRGRPPKPTALKLLEGNPGRRPLNNAEPKPTPGAPKCPSGIPSAARTEWRRIVPELERMGVLTQVDQTALANYCVSYSLWLDALKHIKEHGQIITTVRRHVHKTHEWEETIVKANPAVAQSIAHQKTMLAFLTQFGMTPASRTRIKAEPPMDADPFEVLLNAPVSEQDDIRPN